MAGILHKLGWLEESWQDQRGKTELLSLGRQVGVRCSWYEIGKGRGFVSVCLEKGLQIDFIVHMFFSYC